MEIHLQPLRVLMGLLAVVSTLLVMNVLGLVSTHYLDPDLTLQKLIPLFDFRQENNFPSLYSALAILLCSGMLAVISFSTRSRDRAESRYWLVLAGVFLFLSLDEALTFHEKLIVPVRDLLGTSGLLHWPWVIPYAIGLAVLGLFYLPWLARLPRRTLLLFVGSGIIFVCGAMGFEMLGAQESELHGTRGLWFAVLYTLEELFEMLGIAIFLYALLSYVNDGLPSITIRTRTE